jgi:hypothetical protein
MDRKTSTALIAIVLFGSFFMPFFTWQSFELNGFNFILSDHTPAYKYFLSVIPVLALVRILGALMSEHLVYVRKLLSWIPLITLVVIFIAIYINGNTGGNVFEDGGIFRNTGMGFWLALSLSLLLAFDRPRLQHQY